MKTTFWKRIEVYGKCLPAVLLALATGSINAATPSMEEMWAIIQAQQAEIERLRALVETGRERR